MSDKRFLRRALPILVAVLVPMGLASSAFACQLLATLSVSPNSGPAGTTIKATGNNFASATTAGPVEIRLNTRTAPVLASVPPGNRTFTVDVPLPAGTPNGFQTVIATQKLANGNPAPGTPARSSFKVGAAGATGASAAPVAASTPSAELPIALVAGVGLLVGAVALTRRRSARRDAVSGSSEAG